MDYNNVLFVTVLNGDIESRRRVEALGVTIGKKILKGSVIYRDVLANSSTVRDLVRGAKRRHVKCGGEVWWKRGDGYEDEARKLVAEYIMSLAAEYVDDHKNL